MDSITIKPDREYLREVCDKIAKGRFVVPIFQRDFVWSKSQVLELFDSIKKGYPIGSLVLWHSDDFYAYKNILTDEKIEATVPDYYILDGRQRLTSFFGCISKDVNKKSIFNLGYDLEEEVFCYENDRPSSHPWISISDAFDTFLLIGWLTNFVQKFNYSNAEKISNRAKKLNTILQTYTIGEFYIDNCSLSESTEVFSRINSTGTKINDVEMLQALSFNDSSGGLLKEEIDFLIESLSDYDFNDLRSQDVLLSCYQFVGLRYFESNLEELIKVQKSKGITLLDFMPQIRSTVTQTVRFLHDECYVLHSQLLPYTRQFVELTHFFNKVKNPTSNQLKELKRWFFYTTVKQTFLNGSLSNMRTIHNAFTDFVESKISEAIKYQPIELNDDFSFKFSLKSAISCFMILTQIQYYLKHVQNNGTYEYKGYYTIDTSPLGRLPKLKATDSALISKAKKGHLSNDMREKYAFTNEMTKALHDSNMVAFLISRKESILDMEKDFLTSIGLEVNDPREVI